MPDKFAVVSGASFGKFLSSRIFEPLGMVDTDFWVPANKLTRLCALYVGVDLLDPTKPGLLRADDKPFPEAFTRKLPRESGGGGLVSTLGDTVKFSLSLGRSLARLAGVALQVPFGGSTHVLELPAY